MTLSIGGSKVSTEVFVSIKVNGEPYSEKSEIPPEELLEFIEAVKYHIISIRNRRPNV